MPSGIIVYSKYRDIVRITTVVNKFPEI